MPRARVSLNLSNLSVKLEHRPYVVTILPEARRGFPLGFRQLFASPRYDRIIEAPADAAKVRHLKNCGQITVATPFARENAEVFADDLKEPVVFYITNDNFIREFLYPHEGEDPATTVKRIAFFNRAALVLLKEAELNPRILHCLDWPTALAIAYQKRSPEFSGLTGKTLFTCLDPSFPGVFPGHLRGLLGLGEGAQAEAFFNKYLEFWGEASLAKLGTLLADHTVTGSREIIHEILATEKPGFPGIFRQLQSEGRLHFVFHSTASLKALERLNLEDPSPTELDTLLNLATVYQVRYDRLSPLPKLESMSPADLRRALQRMIVNGEANAIDFSALAALKLILKHPFFTPEQRVLIGKVGHDFGSMELIRFLSTHLEKMEHPQTHPEEKEALKQRIAGLLEQIERLDLNWGLFRRIAERTFGSDAKPFKRLEAITPYQLTAGHPDIEKAGAELLRSGDTAYSPFMVLTMAGGLGARFNLSLTINPETGEVTVPEAVPASLRPYVETLTAEMKQRKIDTLPLPKGLYILPGQPYSLFEQQARAIAKLGHGIGKKIFWTIMTSRENDRLTELYFESNLRDDKYFGVLERDLVLFKTQEDLPAIKNLEGQQDIFITEAGEVYTAAGGHGGFYGAAGDALAEIEQRFGHRVQEILACNIENVLINHQLGSEIFISRWVGYKRLQGDQVTGLAAAKYSPREQMGILARGDNVEQVVEYSHPSMSVFRNFAYESEKRGEVFFVRDSQNQVQVMDRDCFEMIFKVPVENENWMTAVGFDKTTGQIKGEKLLPGYIPVGLDEITHKDTLLPTQLIDGRISPAGSPILGQDMEKLLGRCKLKYDLGNTNIFVVGADFVGLVQEHPELALAEEHKPGKTPFEEHGVQKIERAIFGPLANIMPYESLEEVDQRFKGSLGISVVEAPREDCFEPVKFPSDVEVVRKALEDLLQRQPDLRL